MNSLENSKNDFDKQLLHKVGQECKESFAELYRRFYEPLTRFCYRYLHKPELIEEVVNDTMLVVWQKANQFRDDSKVSTWIMAIAARKCWDLYAKNKKYEQLDNDIPDEIDEIVGSDVYETKQVIHWALKKLSVEHRLTIELAYHNGYTCEEIANIMSCPTNTVKTRLYHARNALKKLLTNNVDDFNKYTRGEKS